MLIFLSLNSPQAVLTKVGAITSKYPGLSLKYASSVQEVQDLLASNTEPHPVVMCLGTQMLEAVQEHGFAPKNRKIMGLRKSSLTMVGVPMRVSYSPSIGDVDYGQFVDFQIDVATACRMAVTGSASPKYGEYEYVKTLDNLELDVAVLMSQGMVNLAFDTETLGLDRFHPDGYIISLQFSVKAHHAYMVVFPDKAASHVWFSDPINRATLTTLLNHDRISVRAANGKYDLEWLWEQAKIPCTNFKFDTTIVGSLLDENRSNALDVHTKIYVPSLGGYSDLFDAKADKSRMDLEYAKDPAQFLLYSAGDADATLQVAAAQKVELLKDPALTSFYVNILHPAARAFEQVERGGVCIDLEAFKELDADLRSDMSRLVTKAKSVVGGILAAKHYDADKVDGLNLTKASLITDFMFSPSGLNLKPKVMTAGGPTGKGPKHPSTAMDHLMMFKDVPEASEFVSILSEYSSTSKTRGTYVGELGISGFLKHVRSDGRMHPTYYLFVGDKGEDEGGTNTGRLSVRDPAWQTIPKHSKWAKPLRRCYVAPQGYLVLEKDYSQGELKIIACIANEATMIQAYLNNMDLHVITSGTMAGKTYEQMLQLQKDDSDQFDALRQLGKAGNFGLIYGMGVEGFMEYARLNYGVALTYAEAEKFRDGFFAKYKELVTYHDTYKAFAKANGYVRSPLGRVRHLPLIRSPNAKVRSHEERRSINAPVQSALSDMTCWAIAEEYKLGWHLEAPCFGAVHDASYNYVPEANPEFYAKRSVAVMESLPFDVIGWTPQLKFTADAKIGPNMADLKKLKF